MKTFVCLVVCAVVGFCAFGCSSGTQGAFGPQVAPDINRDNGPAPPRGLRGMPRGSNPAPKGPSGAAQ